MNCVWIFYRQPEVAIATKKQSHTYTDAHEKLRETSETHMRGKKRWSLWEWLYYGQTCTLVHTHIHHWRLHSTWNNLIKNRNPFSECNAPVKPDTKRVRENMKCSRCYSYERFTSTGLHSPLFHANVRIWSVVVRGAQNGLNGGGGGCL